MSYNRSFCLVVALFTAVVTVLPGCGAVQNATTKSAMKQESAELAAARVTCKSEMSTPELDPVRNKVEIFKDQADTPAPFEMASNDTFPTATDRVAIAKWASLRDACIKRNYALLVIPPSANSRQRLFFEQDHSFVKEANARVGDLIVALYQQKLTYAEFAHRRYDIFHEATVAEAAFRQAALEKDEERQAQAQQQFANSLAAWSLFMQSVNARQPQTVVYVQ
jgi:hypothetical protein